MLAVIAIIAGLAGLAVGAAVGFYVRRQVTGTSLQQAEEQANRVLAEAESKQKETILEAKEEALQIRNAAEAEIRERRNELARSEQRLSSKEENLDRKLETIDRRDEVVRAREAEVDAIRAEAESLRQRQVDEFERISGLTRDQAREQLMAAVEVEIRDDASRRVREIEKEVEATAGVRARKILATAIQRYTSEVTAESTVSVVPIPSDEIKGRIIGREGRNIRAIEAATGVDLSSTTPPRRSL
jgi:ribonuclease Y